MATRALIGIIETDSAGNQVLTSTYNHYDGYPDNLGVALNRHYDELQSAKKISNQGYISYLDPETGAIDAKHKEAAGKDVLPDNFEEAMYEVHAIADSMGADYVYLYDMDGNDWLDSRNSSKALINKFKMSGIDNQFSGGYEDDDLGVPGDNALGLEEGDYVTEWKSFLNEEDNSEKGYTLSVARRALKGMPNLDVYIDSLKNDVRLNGNDSYIGYDSDDWEEDYNNYIADKMDS